jgi:4-amino-4-deoxy-L-arabinose transferase-like glycosyltransferase
VRRRAVRLCAGLIVVLLLAGVLRFYGIDWDGGLGAHPDERYIVGVAEGLRWPDRLSPFAVAPNFAYGHLPLYLLAGVASLARGVDLLRVGRVLAVLFDLGTVALTFALGRRVYGGRVGMVAAAFVALMVAHVQQAHFYTADVVLAFFALGALLFAVRLAAQGRSRDAWLAGAWVGLALGTKFSAALLALPLGAACAAAARGAGSGWRRGLQGGAAALAAFALTNPFALLAFPVFWGNLAEQASIARGVLDVPYTRQFHATWPYLYPLVQQLRWGMGWPLGLIACNGLAYAVWRAVREPPRREEWVLLAWVVPGFALFGALYAKFPRYLLPLTPLLAIDGARMLTALSRGKPLRRFAKGFRGKDILARWKSPPCYGSLQPSQGWGWFPIFFLLIYSLLHCVAFVGLYRSPHPWLAASGWFYDHAPYGSVIAIEHWDHPLPLDSTGYGLRELPVFDGDTPEKWAAIEQALGEADYVVIASRRGYAALARWPERYPLTARYYRLVFEGKLGFEPVACFGRHPRLGPLALTDDPAAGLGFSLPPICQPEASLVLRLGRLDESFVVYDHPQVLILKRALRDQTESSSIQH